MEEEVICLRCGESDYRKEASGPHIKAVCNKCDSYIKFLKQSSVTEDTPMYFGKYKAVKLRDVPAEYLISLIDSGTAGGALKEWLIKNRESIEDKIRK